MKPNPPDVKKENLDQLAQGIWNSLPSNAPKPKEPILKDRTGEKDYRRGLLDSLFWENDKRKDQR